MSFSIEMKFGRQCWRHKEIIDVSLLCPIRHPSTYITRSRVHFGSEDNYEKKWYFCHMPDHYWEFHSDLRRRVGGKRVGKYMIYTTTVSKFQVRVGWGSSVPTIAFLLHCNSDTNFYHHPPWSRSGRCAVTSAFNRQFSLLCYCQVPTGL